MWKHHDLYALLPLAYFIKRANPNVPKEWMSSWTMFAISQQYVCCENVVVNYNIISVLALKFLTVLIF